MNWDERTKSCWRACANCSTSAATTPSCRPGYLEVEAVDADTLRITRCAREGKDVFGEPLAGKAVMVKVSRK